jgi:hypothetical protein
MVMMLLHTLVDECSCVVLRRHRRLVSGLLPLKADKLVPFRTNPVLPIPYSFQARPRKLLHPLAKFKRRHEHCSRHIKGKDTVLHGCILEIFTARGEVHLGCGLLRWRRGLHESLNMSEYQFVRGY